MVVAVNRFTTMQHRQRELVEVIVADIVPALRRQPGFISTVLYRSADGEEVLQLTRWSSVDDHRACMASPEMEKAGHRLVPLLDTDEVWLELRVNELVYDSSQERSDR